MSGTKLLAVSCLLALLVSATASYDLGFALGAVVSRLAALPRRLRRLAASRWYFTRLACAGRWHSLLARLACQLARHAPHATRLRHALATWQRRHRLWLLAELSHLRHEDEPYAR